MTRKRPRKPKNSRQTKQLADQVAERWGQVCWLCHKPIVGQVSPDHVVPVAFGGSDDLDNLRPSHLRCNIRRGTKRPPLPLITTTQW